MTDAQCVNLLDTPSVRDLGYDPHKAIMFAAIPSAVGGWGCRINDAQNESEIRVAWRYSKGSYPAKRAAEISEQPGTPGQETTIAGASGTFRAVDLTPPYSFEGTLGDYYISLELYPASLKGPGEAAFRTLVSETLPGVTGLPFYSLD